MSPAAPRSGRDTRVFADLDGDGRTDLSLLIAKSIDLSPSDFLL